MRKFATFLVGASALLGAQAASATTYAAAGTHVLTGPVTVQKDGSPYDCTLTVTMVVPEAAPDAHGASSHGHSATATAQISGPIPCSLISVSGTGSVSYDGANLTITGLIIDPPLSPGLCDGPIEVEWNGGATPRSIDLSSPLSDSSATSGLPCKMAGTISQTVGGPLDITNP